MTNPQSSQYSINNIRSTNTTLSCISPDASVDLKHIKQLQFLSMIKRQHDKNHGNGKMPTVRKMMQNIQKSQRLQSNTSTPKNIQKTLMNSQFSSKKSIQSHQSNQGKRLKNIFKIISSQRDERGIADNNQRQNQMQTVIYSIIDEIQNTNNTKSFYSQPHFTTRVDSSKRKDYASKLNNSMLTSSTIQCNSFPRPYKTIGNDKSSENFLKKRKSFTKIDEQINKIQTQRAYMNTIKDLDIRNKFQLSRKNLYNAIDPNNTETLFLQPENSRQNISKLFKEKDQKSKEKKKNNSKDKSNNQHVSKLLQTSGQKDLNYKQEMKNTIKTRELRQIVGMKDRKDEEGLSYRRKGKQYFHIELDRRSLSQSVKSDNKKQLNQILPQIKVNGKGQY